MNLSIDQLNEHCASLRATVALLEAHNETLVKVRDQVKAKVVEAEKLAAKRDYLMSRLVEIEASYRGWSEKLCTLVESNVGMRGPTSGEIQQGKLKVDEMYLEVIKSAVSFKTYSGKLCGIYFLVQDDEIFYVGQSVDIVVRLATHSVDRTKRFNKVCFIRALKERLDSLERAFIESFDPPGNYHMAPTPRRTSTELPHGETNRKILL